MCLLPSNNPALAKQMDKQKEDNSDDDDMSDEKQNEELGNLEMPANKDISVYMKVSKFAGDLNSRPKPSHIIRSCKKEKK